MKRPELPPFQIHKQKVERLILTGKADQLGAALDYMAKTNYVISKVGPQLLKAGHRATAKSEDGFILLGEKVIR